ncbi:MAG: hypothetical protein PUI81_03940 [Veillonellaceae bacterium]|nr:hypothetical protein [Veillonellaceae bacterium]MDD6923260.1 hypothetical protein [Veillonellaceae bacterium]
MMDRIEKISPSKASDFDSKRSFHDRNDANDQVTFAAMLRRVPKRGGSMPREAYDISIERATQSLFYEDGTAVRELERRLRAI